MDSYDDGFDEPMELICQACLWSGSPDELVSATDDADDNDFTHCPRCGATEFEELD